MSFGVTTGKTTTLVLPGDGWWPGLELAEFLELYRLPAEYAEALMADHLDLARIWVNRRLASWRATLEAQGVSGEELKQRPFHGVPGGTLRLYKRAVYCRAKGMLLPQFASIERREAAKNDAKDAPETAERFLALAEEAVATLTGKTFISTEAV